MKINYVAGTVLWEFRGDAAAAARYCERIAQQNGQDMDHYASLARLFASMAKEKKRKEEA